MLSGQILRTYKNGGKPVETQAQV